MHQDSPSEGNANALTSRVDRAQLGVHYMISVILKGSSIKAYAPAGRSSVQCPVRCGVALGVGSNGSHPLSEVIGAEGTNQAG